MTNDVSLSVSSGEESTPSGTSTARTPKKNILDQLKDMLDEEVRLPTVEIAVKARKGMTIQYSPNIESVDLRKWRKKSTNKLGDLDNIKFSSFVVAATAEAILLNGEVVVDESENNVVFNSTTVADMVNVDMTQIVPRGVQKFFGVDAHLESTALLILDKAGYGDEIDAEDPTNGSSNF